MRVLGISGSLRRDSENTKLLRVAESLLEAEDAQLVLYDGLKEVPPYDEDDDRGEAPAGIARMRAALADADTVLFATPEYNSSIPGQLKNAIDWMSRPIETSVLRNKPVAVIGASTGMFGAIWAQAELCKVLGAAGARVVGEGLPVARAHECFDADGRLDDPELERALREVVGRLVAEVSPVEAAA